MKNGGDPSGGGSGVSVQDATFLKIQVTYVQPLVVPFIDQISRGSIGFSRD
ncbi:MAG: hypothetical protein ACYDCX_04690 [Acidithiobacillus sp.]